MNIKNLSQIPAVLFERFGDKNLPYNTETFKFGGAELGIIIGKVDYAGEIPLGHAYKESAFVDGRWHAWSYMVFLGIPKPYNFRPDRPELLAKPILQVLIKTDDPPDCTQMPVSWAVGRGYWISETMEFLDGHHFVSKGARGASEVMARLMLDVKMYALVLAEKVMVRGFWQSEKHPKGDYSKEPNIKRLK